MIETDTSTRKRSAYEKRQHMDQRRAYRMACDGCTHREIAAAMNVEASKVKTLIALGCRFFGND